MKSLVARLRKKWGPLPIWVWTGIASAAGWMLLKRSSGADTAAVQTASDPAFVSAGDTGDLAPIGGGSGGDTPPVVAPGEAFPDKGITSDFQDFMNQLFDQELATRAGATATASDPASSGKRVAVNAIDPSTDKPAAKPVAGLAAAIARIKKPRPEKKTAAKPKPKKSPPPRTGGRRSGGAASHGSGGAGARTRTVQKAKTHKARPRTHVRPDDRGGPRPSPKPKPKPKTKRKRLPYRGKH